MCVPGSRSSPNPTIRRCCNKAFDIDYAWDFYHAMSDALAGRVPASFVREVWERAEANYPRGALRLRFSDNHDQLRATGQSGLPAALAASALMFTLDGVPLLYNGMEVGDNTESAAPALFERAPIAWEMAERRPQVTPYYRALAALRRAHPAFTRGAVRWLRQRRRTARAELRACRRRRDRSWSWSTCRRRPYAGVVETPAGEYRDITPDCGRRPGIVDATGCPTCGKLPAVFLGPWEFRVFSAGHAVNTYASDCQVTAAANILALKGSHEVWVIARLIAARATTIVRRGTNEDFKEEGQSHEACPAASAHEVRRRPVAPSFWWRASALRMAQDQAAAR